MVLMGGNIMHRNKDAVWGWGGWGGWVGGVKRNGRSGRQNPTGWKISRNWISYMKIIEFCAQLSNYTAK